MKRTAYILLAATMCVACAKNGTTGSGQISKKAFDAWLEINHPELLDKAVYPGYYIISDKEGSGNLLGDASATPFARVRYTSYSLSGKVLNSSEEEMSRRQGTYKSYNYYGPLTLERGANRCFAGIDAALETMRPGGKRKIIVPGWLMTNSRFGSSQEYIDNYESGESTIYELEVTGTVNDINEWQVDSIENYIMRNFGHKADSLRYGFYKICKSAPKKDIEIPSDSTVYINYICRRLDGIAVDSNIRDTAVKYGFYNVLGSYTPVMVKMAEKYSDITITASSTSVIDGFAYLLKNMKPYEKATGIFLSAQGYGASSTSSIPAYSPLRFDIELTDQKK